jgi:hypothetical protein
MWRLIFVLKNEGSRLCGRNSTPDIITFAGTNYKPTLLSSDAIGSELSATLLFLIADRAATQPKVLLSFVLMMKSETPDAY